MKAWRGCVLLACMLGGCGPPLRPPAPPPPTTPQKTQPPPSQRAPSAPPQSPTAAASVPQLAATIAAAAKRSEGENDSKIRAELATEAGTAAAACLAREPKAAACLYGHALALGLAARAHPTQALDLLRTMLGDLAAAEAADATYDQAGPARVAALVLLRAPGWPLGPGDGDKALVAAQRAVQLSPSYPPNRLALAEALANSGDASGARASYERARDLAQALPPGADRDGWLRAAAEGLRRQ
jgi:hypothetical protein